MRERSVDHRGAAIGNKRLEERGEWLVELGTHQESRREERVVGITSLHFPPVQGNVWTWFTGVVREYRGRGIARGLKLAILKQAIAENVPRVRTDNDETNGPMLHVNEELGYRRIPGSVSYRKPAG